MLHFGIERVDINIIRSMHVQQINLADIKKKYP